jgi:hypothetical protein
MLLGKLEMASGVATYGRILDPPIAYPGTMDTERKGSVHLSIQNVLDLAIKMSMGMP